LIQGSIASSGWWKIDDFLMIGLRSVETVNKYRLQKENKASRRILVK